MRKFTCKGKDSYRKKNNDEKIDPNFDIDYELISKYVETEEEEIRFLDEKIKNFGPVNELAFQEYTDTICASRRDIKTERGCCSV